MSESPFKIVNRGVDTFLVNFKFANEDGKPNGEHLPAFVVDLLDEWQTRARKDHTPSSTDLVFRYRVGERVYEQSLMMRPHGSSPWSWLLFCDDVKLSLCHGTLSGAVFCQARFSSHLLWSISADAAIVHLEEMLYELMGQLIYQQASEIHLCIDMQGFDFSQVDWEHGFVSRVKDIRMRPEDLPSEREQEGGLSPKEARELDESSEMAVLLPMVRTTHRRIATLDFGSHGSQISAQIYNKSAEVVKHKKAWFYPIWIANGWDGKSIVWRLEFRLKRKFLASFDLNEAFSVLSQMKLLWTYVTCEWLRYVDLSGQDSNKSRLSTHPIWEIIQQAYTVEDDVQTRDPEGESEVRLTHLLEEKPLDVLKMASSLALEESLQEECLLTEEEITSVSVESDHSSLLNQSVLTELLRRVVEQRMSQRLSDDFFTIGETFSEESRIFSTSWQVSKFPT